MEVQNQEARSQKPEEGKTPSWQPEFPRSNIYENLEQAIDDVAAAAQAGPIQNPPPSGAPKSEIENPLLPLAASERFITLREKLTGRKFVHRFKPLLAEDWIQHERGIRPSMRRRGEDGVEFHSSSNEASNALWLDKVVRVEGYGEPEIPERVPLRHRLLAIDALGMVYASDDQDELPDTENVVVVLEAEWNGIHYARLMHRFKRPLVEHELRFEEATRRSALVTHKVGGERHPKKREAETISLPQLPALIKLYDEIITSIEGYGFSNSSIFNLQSSIQLMDALHKSAAVRALFASNVELEMGSEKQEEE